mgnify:CR=1 FL=1
MKKLILMAAMMVATLAVNAQVYVGGSLGFESVKEHKDADALSSFSIKPEAGYNLDENWAVGIQLGFSSIDIDEDNSVSTFEVAPYARYTFAKTGIASFFVDGGIQFISYGSDMKGSTFGIGVRPGIKLAASKKVDVIAKLGYLGYSKDNDDLGGGSAFGLNVNNTNLEFGVFFNF